MKKLIFLLAVTALFMGCAVKKNTDFTLLSTKQINYDKNLEKSEKVTGEDKVYTVLGWTTGTPELKNAVNNAMSKVPNTKALADVSYYYLGWSFLLYGEQKCVVEGTALTQQ